MKKFTAILLRDKIDLGIWILVIAAFVQHFIIGKNLTSGFLIMILYVFFVMYRLYTYNMVIRKQDQDIKDLNVRYSKSIDEWSEEIKKLKK